MIWEKRHGQSIAAVPGGKYLIRYRRGSRGFYIFFRPDGEQISWHLGCTPTLEKARERCRLDVTLGKRRRRRKQRLPRYFSPADITKRMRAHRAIDLDDLVALPENAAKCAGEAMTVAHYLTFVAQDHGGAAPPDDDLDIPPAARRAPR
jgi:hypothetical protein